ncbi:MAG: gluconate 2-dehydrogenase subunit 3 family protein [Ferruginibacter sp.]|nr:gluconate 2-dehydrogenase subunit 3 family protein [Cytophagales bacterium]
MDRREALHRVTALMGGTLSAPAVFALLEGCQTKPKTAQAGKAAPFISDNHSKMIAEISEIIIPTTNTPGAKAAKVPEFIALMLADCYTKPDQDQFFAGLDQLDADANKAYGNAFLKCQPAQQTELLKKAEADAKAVREQERLAAEQNKNAKATSRLLFFPTMKELTLVGYFSSEVGATQALEYVPVPTRYEGCIDLKPGQKAWAT